MSNLSRHVLRPLPASIAVGIALVIAACDAAELPSNAALAGSANERSDAGSFAADNPSSGQLSVYLVVQPLNGSSPVSQWVGPITIAQGARLPFPLPAPISVTGNVVSAVGLAAPGVNLFFSPQSQIPNRPQAPFQIQTDENGAFTIALPEDSYSVVLYAPSYMGVPTPPQYAEQITLPVPVVPLDVDGGVGQAQPIFTLWDPATLVPATGTVTTEDGLSTVGVQVSAIEGPAGSDVAAGASQLEAQPVLTANANSATTSGAFSLLLPPGSGPGSTELQFGPGVPIGIDFPVIDYAFNTYLSSLTGIVANLNVFAVQLEGDVMWANAGEANATVILMTQSAPAYSASGGAAAPFSYQTTVTTDPTGHFVATVYTLFDADAGSADPDGGTIGAPTDGGTDGSVADGGADAGSTHYVYYSAIAIPASSIAAVGPGLCRPPMTGTNQAGSAADSTLSLVAVPYANSPSQKLTTFATTTLGCDVVVGFSGIVSPAASTAGTPSLQGTQVTAVRQPTTDLPGGLTLQATTSAHGNFELQLPAGIYDIVYAPPAASGQAFRVDADVAVASAPSTQGIALPNPITLSGNVSVGSTGNTIAAQVDAYAVVGNTSVKIATATSGPDGAISLILPGPTQ